MTPASSLRLAFLADDFTGATDALEVLAAAGWRVALFTDPPTPEALAAAGPLDALGLATDLRTLSPTEAARTLPPLLQRLAALPVPWLHLKVCSTFDSAPDVGSIGAVIDLARPVLGATPAAIVAATPALGRHGVFGHLFARSATDGQVHRIDRHPVMARHPVTPMAESDLRRHLAAQTATPIGLFALPCFDEPPPAREAEADRLAISGGAVLFDGVSAAHVAETGRLLLRWADSGGPPRLVIGGSGVESAFAAAWAARGWAAPAEPPGAAVSPVPALFAVSGSASAVSGAQIDAARAAGFVDLPADAAALLDDDPHRAAAATGALVDAAVAGLAAGRPVVLHTARGPDDPRLAVAEAGSGAPAFGDREARGSRRARQARLGQQLATITDAVLRRARPPRLVVCGGDTASRVVQHLAVRTITVACRLAPGAPLCRLAADTAHVDGLEVVLKGGQMGPQDLLVQAWHGWRDDATPSQDRPPAHR